MCAVIARTRVKGGVPGLGMPKMGVACERKRSMSVVGGVLPHGPLGSGNGTCAQITCCQAGQKCWCGTYPSFAVFPKNEDIASCKWWRQKLE